MSDSLDDAGKATASALVGMVAALEVDYDRLDELRALRDDCQPNDGEFSAEDREELAELEEAAGDCADRDEAEQRIHEDALSVEVRSGWVSLGGTMEAEEFLILLSTGGPAARIMGELENGEPKRAWLEVQDWGTPWTLYYKTINTDTLLAYVRCFYFGD